MVVGRELQEDEGRRFWNNRRRVERELWEEEKAGVHPTLNRNSRVRNGRNKKVKLDKVM
jgi:hypothetical protein